MRIIILTFLLFILDINAISDNIANDNTNDNDDKTTAMLSNQLKETLKLKVSSN